MDLNEMKEEITEKILSEARIKIPVRRPTKIKANVDKEIKDAVEVIKDEISLMPKFTQREFKKVIDFANKYKKMPVEEIKDRLYQLEDMTSQMRFDIDRSYAAGMRETNPYSFPLINAIETIKDMIEYTTGVFESTMTEAKVGQYIVTDHFNEDEVKSFRSLAQAQKFNKRHRAGARKQGGYSKSTVYEVTDSNYGYNSYTKEWEGVEEVFEEPTY
jgi:hypothetical protein